MNSSFWNCPTFPEQPPLCAGVPKVGSQAKLIDVNLKTCLSVQILSFFWEGMIQLLFLFFSRVAGLLPETLCGTLVQRAGKSLLSRRWSSRGLSQRCPNRAYLCWKNRIEGYYPHTLIEVSPLQNSSRRNGQSIPRRRSTRKTQLG